MVTDRRKRSIGYRHAFFTAGLASVVAGLLSTQKVVTEFLRTHLLLGYEVNAGLVRQLPPFPALAIAGGLALLVFSALAFLMMRYGSPLGNLAERVSRRLDRPLTLLGRNSTKLSVLILAIVVFSVYFRSLSFNFAGDDFLYIHYLYRDGIRGLLPWNWPQFSYHYKPVGVVLVAFLYPLVGYSPSWFHFETLAFHALSSVLIFILCRRLTNNRLVALLAGLVFATCVSALEVVMWVSGIFYSAMTSFVLLALLCFIRHFDEGRKYYWAFLGLYLMAQLTIEVAVLLIPLCFLYEVLFQPHREEISGDRSVWSSVGRLKKYIPPCAILLSFVVIKLYYHIFLSNVFLRNIELSTSFTKLMYGLLYSFVPGAEVVGLSQADVLVLAGLFAALSLLVLTKGSRPMKFSYLWACLTTAAVLTLTAGFHPRYFYLPVVGASLFIAILMHDACRWVSQAIGRDTFSGNNPPAEGQRDLVLNVVKLALFLPLALAIVLVGVRLVGEEQKGWQKASDTVTRVLADMERLFPEPVGDREVHFVDIPSELISAEPRGLYRALGVGFVDALALTYGRDFATSIHLRYTPYHPHTKLPFSEPISYEEVLQLARDPEKVVVVYDDRIESVRRLQPEPTAEK